MLFEVFGHCCVFVLYHSLPILGLLQGIIWIISWLLVGKPKVKNPRDGDGLGLFALRFAHGSFSQEITNYCL